MSFVVQDGFGIPESKERVFLSCNSHVFYFSPQMSVFESTLLVQNTRMDSVGFIWLEFH